MYTFILYNDKTFFLCQDFGRIYESTKKVTEYERDEIYNGFHQRAV